MSKGIMNLQSYAQLPETGPFTDNQPPNYIFIIISHPAT